MKSSFLPPCSLKFHSLKTRGLDSDFRAASSSKHTDGDDRDDDDDDDDVSLWQEVQSVWSEPVKPNQTGCERIAGGTVGNKNQMEAVKQTSEFIWGVHFHKTVQNLFIVNF